MRNLSVSESNGASLNGCIVAVRVLASKEKCVRLTKSGELLFTCDDLSLLGQLILSKQRSNKPVSIVNLNKEVEVSDENWFGLEYVIETNSLICVSHGGSIVSLSLDKDDCNNGDADEKEVGLIQLEGEVEKGIKDAKWNPDCSSVAILTGGNSILLMTCYFEVLSEIPCEPMKQNSISEISWRGDGLYFAVKSVDDLDGLSCLRVYKKDGELNGVGRNVAIDAAGEIVKNLGDCVCFSPNGSLIAVPLQKTVTRSQIAFFETNGLRHGEFDLQIPKVSQLVNNKIVVKSLHWDMTSSLLAVSFSFFDQTVEELKDISYVQVYIRNNYHWFLKQEFSGVGLSCLGFDLESLSTLHLSEYKTNRNVSIVYDIELVWTRCVSNSDESSIAVVDGSQILLTPLGLSLVPPPISAFKTNIKSSCNSCAFSSPCHCSACMHFVKRRQSGNLVKKSLFQWTLACLCSDDSIALICGDHSGNPVQQFNICLHDYLGTLLTSKNISSMREKLVFKSLSASYKRGKDIQGDEVIVSVVSFDLRGVLNSVSSSEQNYFLQQHILTLRVSLSDGTVKSCSLFSGFSGSVTSLSSVPFNCSFVAAGVNGSSGFDVQIIDVTSQDGTSTVFSGPINIIDEVTLPEVCPIITILCDELEGEETTAEKEHLRVLDENDKFDNDNGFSDKYDDNDFLKTRWVAVGLSSRNRLYCGEALLVSGASSFALNHKLGILTYITVGTKPALHYLSISAVVGLSTLLGHQAEEGYFLECGDPRPVERGARLVACIPGEPKTVIELPRGNLEAFEPRALVLMKARLLIQQGLLSQCLVMLRRQKVDLNYIVDFDPPLFFIHVNKFVIDVMKQDPDLLSLFLSSLEPGNASIFKYPIAIVGRISQDSPESSKRADEVIVPGVFWGDMIGPRKLWCVCDRVRQALVGHNSSQSLRPLLCAFAKQMPPALEDALDALAVVHCPGISSSGLSLLELNNDKTRVQLLGSAKAQASIKYLSFLAAGSALFESALGKCDFVMAQAVARQDADMDPKIYMPLLTRLEQTLSIPENVLQVSLTSSDFNKDIELLFREQFVRFEVNVYLKRNEKIVEEGVKLLEILVKAEINNQHIYSLGSDDSIRSVDEIQSILFKTTNENSFHLHTITLLSKLSLSNSSLKTTSLSHSGQCLALLRNLKLEYGNQCLSKQLHSEAITAFLTASPPFLSEAIKASRLAGDWQLTLSLNARQAQIEGADPLARLKRVASEIVSGFKESLEQGDTDLLDEASLLPSYLQNKGSRDHFPNIDKIADFAVAQIDGGDKELDDKASEIARISIDYCQDFETAVSVLLLTRKWSSAILIAFRGSRLDLLSEEIGPNIREAAIELISLLPNISSRFLSLVNQLSSLWEKPEERLLKVKEIDPDSFVLKLTGQDKHKGDDETNNDSRSEFSAVSHVSRISYVSHASAASSQVSSSSSVSVLSQLSLSRTKQHGDDGVTSTDSFSISGIDHTLLSRGKQQVQHPDEVLTLGGQIKKLNDKKVSEKRQKRYDRKRAARGFGSDAMDLKGERDLCVELWSLAQFDLISREASALCEALLILNESNSYSLNKVSQGLSISHNHLLENGKTSNGFIQLSDCVLASVLQASVDDVASKIKSNPPPIAPHYPVHFLVKKNMTVLLRYQDFSKNGINTDDEKVLSSEEEILKKRLEGVKSWWQTAADGIIKWQKSRKLNLNN